MTDDIIALLAALDLPPALRPAVEQIHAPLADWIERQAASVDRALAVGVCGAQGSGKSTAAVVIKRLLEDKGLHVAALSIDDLYLTRADRQVLAKTVHPLMATRGPPGTHDVPLGEAVVAALGQPGLTAIPAFDKARDDRRPRESWPVFVGPADIILLEGWCVGAASEADAALLQPINALERDEDPDGVWRRYVNAALVRYQPLFATLDRLILFAAPSFEVVERWRGEQEADLRAEAPGGPHLMNEAALHRFIQHYERLTRAILLDVPTRADALVELGAARELKRLVLR